MSLIDEMEALLVSAEAKAVALAAPPPPPPPTAIAVGVRVLTTSPNKPSIKIRATPDTGAPASGTQSLGAAGTVDGALTANFWRVNFESGTDGWVWSTELAIHPVQNPTAPPPVPAPTITGFAAVPGTINAGQSTTLNAMVANAVALAIDGVAIPSLPQIVAPTASRTYTLTATGPGGSASAQAMVTVAAAPPPPPPPGDLSWFLSRPVGSITNLGTAMLQSLAPVPSAGGTGGFKAIFAASGMVLCPWRGRAGTLVFPAGGGHDDCWDNGVYEWDLYTNTGQVLKQPNRALFVGPSGYHSDTAEGEHYIDAAGSGTHQDQPSSGHNYGLLDVIPPNAEFPQGAIITFARASLTRLGQRHGTRAHVFDFATMRFSRFSTNRLPVQPNYAGGFIDKGRNRAIVPGYDGMYPLDLATRTYGARLGTAFSTEIHMVWSHYVAQDVYAGLLRRNGVTHLWVVDPVTGALTKPGVSGTWPTPNLYDGGSCWSELLGGIAHYHGQGESILSLVRPPSGNPRTTPWPVTAIGFSGDTPARDTQSGAGAHCKRFLEHPAAGGFQWAGRTDAPFQFVRV